MVWWWWTGLSTRQGPTRVLAAPTRLTPGTSQQAALYNCADILVPCVGAGTGDHSRDGDKSEQLGRAMGDRPHVKFSPVADKEDQETCVESEEDATAAESAGLLYEVYCCHYVGAVCQSYCPHCMWNVCGLNAK